MPIMGLKGFARAAWRQLTAPGVQFTAESDPQPIDRIVTLAMNGTGGLKVTRAVALSVPAVSRARNLVCGIATLPLRQVDSSLRPVVSTLLDQLDRDVPNVVTVAQTVDDLFFEAISWWKIMARDPLGFPTSVRHLDVNTVSLNPPTDGRPRNPLPSNVDPHEATVWVAGHETRARDVIRFDSPLPGMLDAGRRAIRRALFLDEMSELYARNPRPLDYFTPAEGADPAEDDDVRAMLTDWNAARKEGTTAYVPAALQYNVVDVPTPADLQLLPQADRATREIANLAGLDPEDFGVSTTSRTYQNAVDRRQDKINETYSPYMRAITDRLSMPDVTPPGHKIIFNLDEYLRADPKTRADVEGVYIDKGVMTPEEIRTREHLPPGAPTPPEPAGQPSNVRQLRTTASFDAPSHTFVDVPVRNFDVNVQNRTIEGLVVPYGETSSIKGGRRFEFAPGALQPPAKLSRNKMLRDHLYSAPLGKLIFHERRPDGDFARYKIAEGPEGDRALSLAADEILDGLSVGVDFGVEYGGYATDHMPHPTKRGVTLILRADWRETSLLAMPSFEGARVTRVAASATNGGSMPCSHCGHVHDAGTPCVATPPTPPITPPPAPPVSPSVSPPVAPPPVTFTIDQVRAMLAAANQLPADLPVQASVVNPSVNPAPGGVTVREPSPYRFDQRGNLLRGSHDFSTDLVAFSRGDRAAGDRAESFVREQFVITTDVDELNPTRMRPDMYVDQRNFQYPVWDAINKGTLTDITPFTFPKFNSAGTLVAAHVEGTEPSLGTFTATNQTVTPAAKSGKVKLSRETWDQGGNPQVSGLIWRQMVKAWYEALEAAAVAALDAVTPTAITFTTGGGTTGQTLDAEVRAAWAGLQFIRGGFTMDTAFAQIDLYKALAAGKDTTGRALYPNLGPTNATGTITSRSGAIDVGGVVFHPAWALAATGVVAASSYLFDREVVHGWASAPERIDINLTEVANVYIGLWGYVATAISDLTGVRELIYDPA